MPRPRRCGETWVETGTAMQRPLIILDPVESRPGILRDGPAGATVAGHPARTLRAGA